MIADFSEGPPVRGKYWENWGQFANLDGFHEAQDIVMGGNFMHFGHDQVLLLNRHG
jgi:hypothetical protein